MIKVTYNFGTKILEIDKNGKSLPLTLKEAETVQKYIARIIPAANALYNKKGEIL